MPATKSKKPAANHKRSHAMETAGLQVITAKEAAAFLRVSEEDVIRLAREQILPGRVIGDEWRFLKDALTDWLRKAVPSKGKDSLLAMAGQFREDPFLDEIVQEAYRQRLPRERRV